VNPNKILKTKCIKFINHAWTYKNSICIENLQHNLTEGCKGKCNIGNPKNEGNLKNAGANAVHMLCIVVSTALSGRVCVRQPQSTVHTRMYK
jgi:hypothetical protein